MKSKERLYLLKGQIGLVGDDEDCTISFCLPWRRNGRLAYLSLSFSKEELERNTPEQFIEVLKVKVEVLGMSWEDHRKEVKNHG